MGPARGSRRLRGPTMEGSGARRYLTIRPCLKMKTVLRSTRTVALNIPEILERRK
jgi:hypothetical protein